MVDRRKDPVRDFEMCALFSGGEKLQEIATRYDLSRERVRQILKRQGLESVGTQRHDPLKIIKCAQNALSVKEVAAKMGIAENAVSRVLHALAPMAVVEMAAYRFDKARARCITMYQELAVKLGHTPTATEWRNGIYPPYFSSFTSLQRAAGFSTAYRRRRKHLTPDEKTAIGQRYQPGNRSHNPGNMHQIMVEFNVSAQTVYNICRKRNGKKQA